MFYRRNADTRLRNLERALQLNYTIDNLIAYNQELLRHGMPTVAATQTMTRQAIGNLLPDFYVWGLDDLQFPGLEIQLRMTEFDATYPVLPRTPEHFAVVDTRVRSVIPLLLSLGWVALVQQCGEVSLRLKRNKEYDEWIVEYRVDGELDGMKSYYTNDKQDAEQTMSLMQRLSHPAQYPEILTVPRTVMEPSGRPIVTRAGRIVADQWRKGENPRSLEVPEFRQGTYPTAIILVERPEEILRKLPVCLYCSGNIPVGVGDRECARHEDPNLVESPLSSKNYVTWAYRVPYEEGVSPSTDHGHYDMTLAEAKVDYLCRLLVLPSACSYQLFES